VDIRPLDSARAWAALRQALPESATVWVFGSRAKNTARPTSDLDLAIDAGRPLTREESGALQDAFEESDLPYSVDVVDLHAVTPSFLAIIDRDKVMFTPPKDSAHEKTVMNRG
jgi:type I restriction enzyme S subunit